MKYQDKTKGQLIAELQKVRQRVTESEQAEIQWQSTETALRQSEENLHTMLNSIGDAVIATDTDGNVIRMNPVAERLTGWKMNEAEGKPLSEVFCILNSQTREKADNPVRQVTESREIVRLANHTVLIARDGKEYQIADSAAPILDAEGDIAGVVLVFRDVTEAYKVQERLRESEEKLEQNLAELNAIINALPGIVSVVDTDFNVLVANDEVYKRFGQGSLYEVIGKACYATRKGLEQPCPQCGLLVAFKTGETISRVSTPEEEELMGIVTKSYAIPLKDENGVIWGGVEVIMDITDIRKTEENLRKSKEQMQLALQGADLGLWDWNLMSGKVTYNRNWAEMLGYALTEIEPNSSSWEKLVHPDDVPGVMKALDAHLDGKAPIYETEHRLLAKNGTWKWILARGKVIEWDHAGNPMRATGTHLDITERKQAEQELRESEEKYRALINGMHDTVWVIDFDGNFIDVNSAAAEILGYSREELLSMGPTDIDSNLDAETIKNLIRDMPSDKLQVFETIHTTKDGKPIPVEIQSCMVKYQGQDAILSIGRDITDRKQAEEERLRLRKLESVGVLAGGIAHDFNNLLTAVFGNIEMAKLFLSTDHESYKFLEYAGQSMESATHLTSQLLTFSRGGDPIKETLSIGEALVETAQFSLRGSNAQLQTNIAPDLWTVEADKGQLSQVISNLVLNAQQGMPTGGIITLTAENIETSERRYVQITVQDEGVGIAPQYLDQIFDPYFTTKQKGRGLGLAVTHSIINKHSGTITVDSTLNQGTTFTIRLPAAEAVEKIIPGKASDEIDSEPVSAAHILVLDDQEAVRNVLGAMLEKMGHRVSYAAAGQEAISKYRSAQQNDSLYDVVITDLTIPGGMGGEAVAQEILAINPQAKIIVSSGYATDSIMANYKEYGFQGRIAKPYGLAEVQKVVEQALKV